MSKFGAKKKAVESVESNTKPKKGGVTVNLDNDKPRIVKNGEEATKVSRKPAQDKANKSVGVDKAGKAEKVSKEKAERTPKEVDTRKIKLLTKENPKREGSASFDRFELYRSSKTVAEFLENGGTTGDLRYDEKAGHIQVA